MTIQEACKKILGDDIGQSIIDEQGIHWAVVAAMTEARRSDDPEALSAITEYNKRRQVP